MHTKKVKVISQNAYSSTFKPLGYIRNKEGKLLPATLENGATLNQVAQLRAYRLALLAYLSGYSMRRIATLLEEEFGLTPRGKKWSHKSVKSILENPIYAQIMRSKFLKAS
ncbi:recombinase family protein [Bacillus sp. SJS]|uniref:recombinase family protein n=1 Tax=Bacillus sp. SJS TaxID=1423321 RepID=UPI0022B2487E|nr:recombinase family protein [Bacillus sp. SJS]